MSYCELVLTCDRLMIVAGKYAEYVVPHRCERVHAKLTSACSLGVTQCGERGTKLLPVVPTHG